MTRGLQEKSESLLLGNDALTVESLQFILAVLTALDAVDLSLNGRGGTIRQSRIVGNLRSS